MCPLQGKKGGAKDAGPKEESDIFKIVRMISDRNFDPCIVFSFSKKECEALAGQVRGGPGVPATLRRGERGRDGTRTLQQPVRRLCAPSPT